MTPFEVVGPGPGHRGALCWRFPESVTMLSSASVGGGLGLSSWLLNVGVHKSYARMDLDVYTTVGITSPTWAADRSGGFTPWEPGTINMVVQLPVRLPDAALVNIVVTVTEAKTQALAEVGVPGTGTASDAVVITCPTSGVTDMFGGPRSLWGSRAALAVYDAVLAGRIPAVGPCF